MAWIDREGNKLGCITCFRYLNNRGTRPQVLWESIVMQTPAADVALNSIGKATSVLNGVPLRLVSDSESLS